MAVSLVWATPLFSQCSAHLLGCLDEESTPQTFAVSVWTSSAHCPASGHISLMSEMPGIEFGYYMDSFFDVFTEIHRVKPELIVYAPPPPMMPFLIHAMVTFDDPIYPSLAYAEQVMWDPGLGRLVIARPSPCYGDDVPPFMMPMTAACFKTCHRIYYVDMGSSLTLGRPIINVVPGCATGTNCSYDPCVPGNPSDYVYNVYSVGGRWILEFEYSNPNAEPRCYCVSYTGNQPMNYAVHKLGALNELTQTLDLTLWMEQPGDMACGVREVFSYPSGAYIGAMTGPFDATDEKRTVSIPVGPGSFLPGQEFSLIAYHNFGPPRPCVDYTDQWLVERVMVTSEGGLRVVDAGGECDAGAVYVPPALPFGAPECITVCHDVYHIPLAFTGPGTPQVMVTPGCFAPCFDPTCNPGGPWDYRYDLIQVGGSWILEFEHSNPQNEPACYCIQFYNVIPQPCEPRLLGALDEERQMLNVSLWSTSCVQPWNGHFTVASNPPYALDPGGWVESFFDVFCSPRTWEIPVHPTPMMLPGQNFQITVECDFFGPGSDPFDGIIYCENVVVTPTGQLALWDPSSPCVGDWVPPSMVPQESQCFHVCHRIYETVLYYNPGGGRPVISVTPGCQGPPMDNCLLTPCVPGGPQDFVYDVYHDGMNWILRFEYSNPYVEPVCYCVTYEGNVPYDCETRELAALDEGHMQFEVSLKTLSHEGHPCPASGHLTIFSSPPGALIGGYPDSFFDVFTEWYTVNPPVDRGSFQFGEAFQLCAYIDYTDPAYPDQWLTEDVIVNDAGYLNILDVGGQCVGDVTPPEMLTGTSECFKVCHRIYHIPISDATDPTAPPIVTITPGCFGPPQDQCLPDPDCIPGGEHDYRFTVWWAGDHWELEFEYSNENIEPVCYCVSVSGVQPPPCETHELVAFDSENQLLMVSLKALDPSGVYPCEVSGTIHVSSDPPDLYFEDTVWTFSGVGEDWVVFGKPSAPEPYNPGRPSAIIVEFDYDDPGLPDVIETEMVQMDLTGSGGIVGLDTGGECAAGGGAQVPEVILPGQPECLVVCHDVYYIRLDILGFGAPTILITPGCDPANTLCDDPDCTPGGAQDYRYEVFKVGGTWWLEFEYSNANVEPVCYCAEIFVLTVPYEAYMLATLDEENQMFDVTLWTSEGAPLADGELIVRAEPDMTVTIPFMGVGMEYMTWEIPAGIGTLTPGQTFQLTVIVQFMDAIFGRLHYEETVIVTPGGNLMRWDPITPCVGDHVPASMNEDDAACFVVCHKIYDILLNAPPTAFPPNVTVRPGCFGPPWDDCLYHPECRPGGPNDFCYRFRYDGIFWHLIFEYSNPYREPVCYCVTIGDGPCWPVTDLVMQAPDPEAGVGARLVWTAWETATYEIYTTTDGREEGLPPGGTWQFVESIDGMAGMQMQWYPTTGDLTDYRRYCVIADCGPNRAR